MAHVSRRELFKVAGAFGAGSLLPGRAPARDAASAPLRSAAITPAGDPNFYRSIGVRPIINCRGTFTIIGGSIELPEVRSAKTAANQQYVQLDELMDAVGKR